MMSKRLLHFGLEYVAERFHLASGYRRAPTWYDRDVIDAYDHDDEHEHRCVEHE